MTPELAVWSGDTVRTDEDGELRGGMDASQYKDYVLFMLFIKYITDKYGNSTDFAPPVTIPKGADSGSRIRLTGKAPGGGDLHVVITQRPHAVFKRRGIDLERELPLTLGEALLGAEVPVRILKGRVLLTIPAGTQTGRTFRLKGQGMPRFRADGHGDLYVKAD